jgi:hypothetical protein
MPTDNGKPFIKKETSVFENRLSREDFSNYISEHMLTQTELRRFQRQKRRRTASDLTVS